LAYPSRHQSRLLQIPLPAQWDSSASRSRRNAGSSTIDPDDNDIEAYYQDNIDEYDDYISDEGIDEFEDSL
jgi:hypothetical protein